MDPEEYNRMYAVECRHWWYGGMETITRALLNRWIPPGQNLRILDAGCGTGAAMTTYLKEYGCVTGLDLSKIALNFCHARQADRLMCGSVASIPIRSGIFDLVTSFDVLYEQTVPNDLLALKEFTRVLVQGGRLLLRLPAYDWLRGRHDAVVHTARRYTTGQVAALLVNSGLAIEKLSYANMFLFPAALFKRMAERIWPSQDRHSDLEYEFGPINGFLKAVLDLEAPLVSGRGLPFGLSIFALGRKI